MDCYMLHNQQLQKCALHQFLQSACGCISTEFQQRPSHASEFCGSGAERESKIRAALAKLKSKDLQCYSPLLQQLASCGVSSDDDLELITREIVQRVSERPSCIHSC